MPRSNPSIPPWIPVATAALIFLVLGAPCRTWAAPDDSIAEAEAKFVEADAASTAGRHHDAAELYLGAYEALPEFEKTTSFGLSFIEASVDARQRAFEQTGQTEELTAAKALLEQFIANVKKGPPEVAEAVSPRASKRLAKIESLLESGVESDVFLEIPKAPTGETTDQSTSEEARSEDPPDNDRPTSPVIRQDDSDERNQNDTGKSRPLALGLTIGGGAALAAGIAQMAYGGWFASRTRSRHESWVTMYPDAINDAELTTWREHELRNARVHLGVGATIAVAGAAAATLGVIWLVTKGPSSQAHKSSPRLHISPALVRITW